MGFVRGVFVQICFLKQFFCEGILSRGDFVPRGLCPRGFCLEEYFEGILSEGILSVSRFQQATVLYGVPSRLRTDKGGENVLLWDEMETLRGPDRGSCLIGSSTHNQRIERLWRDVWLNVCHEFYYAFQSMECEGKLLAIMYFVLGQSF